MHVQFSVAIRIVSNQFCTMELRKSLFLLLLAYALPLVVLGQELKSNLFLRTPQVVNYNLHTKLVNYTPVISVGAGLSHRSKFLELATFIGDNDSYGYYTFFGTTLKTTELQPQLQLNTNWFGEVTYVPEQTQNPSSFTYTTGVFFFLNHSLNGVP